MAVFSLRRVFREQWSTLPLPSPPDDIGSKTLIVTGSNVGLGFEASVHLAKLRPELLIATSRDAAKCKRTRESILERADAVGVANPHVATWTLDLNSFDSVRAFVDRFAAQGNGILHTFVANAGVYHTDYVQTPDGWEVMLQVNYLSTALLSILLLPYLANASHRADSDRPHLVVVSSFGHYLGVGGLKKSDMWTNILETLNSRKFGSSVTRYNISKLLEVIFIRELARRLPDPTPVVACAVNPGYCRWDLFRAIERRWYVRWICPLIRKMLWAHTTEEGSRTLVHAAVSGDARSMHGRYLSSCHIAEECDFVFTPQGMAFSAKLWDETITVLSRVHEGVSEIVSKYLQTDA